MCDIAKKNNLYCVEDSCEALGSVINNRQVGTLGDISIFAFYPNKQITTGEGGILLTDNKAVADLCYSFRNQGRNTEGGWLAHARMGYNYRLSDINCAIGTVQLGRIDEFIKKKSIGSEHIGLSLAAFALVAMVVVSLLTSNTGRNNENQTTLQ
mgnify:CR=1 FL=1